MYLTLTVVFTMQFSDQSPRHDPQTVRRANGPGGNNHRAIVFVPTEDGSLVWQKYTLLLNNI